MYRTIGYQIQFYTNNQCDFVLSQLCFDDLKQFCCYGASERYLYWIMMLLFVIICIPGGTFKIVNWHKNILVNYDRVCLVIDKLLASTLFMNLTSTIFQFAIIIALTREKDFKVDCKTYLVYTYNKGYINCIMHSMTVITIYYTKKCFKNNYQIITIRYRIVNIQPDTRSDRISRAYLTFN